jgi:hypothetical protein
VRLTDAASCALPRPQAAVHGERFPTAGKGEGGYDHYSRRLTRMTAVGLALAGGFSYVTFGVEAIIMSTAILYPTRTMPCRPSGSRIAMSDSSATITSEPGPPTAQMARPSSSISRATPAAVALEILDIHLLSGDRGRRACCKIPLSGPFLSLSDRAERDPSLSPPDA